jgi:hypothetical protein
VAVWGHSSPLVDTNWSVYLDRFALLSGAAPTQVLPGREEVFKPPVISHDAVDDASARAHDMRGQQKRLRAKSAGTPILIKSSPRRLLGKTSRTTP